VTLTANDGSSSDTATATANPTDPAANQPPVAGFTVSCTDLACTFTNTSTDPEGDPLTFQWDFGDGGSSTAVSPTHPYATGGSYNVTLTANDGSSSDTATATANPTDPAPQTITAATYPILLSGRTASVSVDMFTGNGFETVPGAEVDGEWTYLDRRGRTRTVNASGMSNPDGTATFEHNFPRHSTVQSFCVTDVRADGYIYVPTVACTDIVMEIP
jgi:PKD repeat protein